MVMKFFQRLSILLFLLPVLLAGTVSAEGTTLDIVTQVQITCRTEEAIIHRQYMQPHKISAVLNYLRLLDCKGKADTDPEQLTGDSFEIVLYDICGQRSIYRQRANRFFSKNSKPWLQVSPVQASRLYSLLQAIPSDPPAS